MNPSKMPIPPTVQSPSIVPELPEVDWESIIGHPVRKRSVVVRNHKTSLSIEEPFWSRLLKFAARHECPVSEVVAMIDDRHPKNLSSAVRMFVLLLDDQEATIEEQLEQIGALESKMKQQTEKLESRIARLKTLNAKLRDIAGIDDTDTEEARP